MKLSSEEKTYMIHHVSKGTGIIGYMDHCSCCDVSEITGSVSYTHFPGVSVTRRTIAFLQKTPLRTFVSIHWQFHK